MRHGTWGQRRRLGRALIPMACVTLVYWGIISPLRGAPDIPSLDDSHRQYVWVLEEGSTTITFDRAELGALGLKAGDARHHNASKDAASGRMQTVRLPAEPGSRIIVERGPDGLEVVSASLRHSGGIELSNDNLRYPISAFTIADDRRIPYGDLLARSESSNGTAGLWLRAITMQVDNSSRTATLWTDEVTLSPELARELGLRGQHGALVATVSFEGRFFRLVEEDGATTLADPLLDIEPSSRATAGGSVGPDVIVISLQSVASWGSDIDPESLERISAFSVGTTSCNIGDEPATWIQRPSNQHPVIGQNLYRLKDGRFEQIGMSWLKHGFFAVTGDQCGTCIDPPGISGNSLGVNCSDPYGATLNGAQTNLGPRSTVNAFTGFFPTTVGIPQDTIIDRRLQVRTVDVEPTLNPGALYFIEGQYVTPDDALAGNGLNNDAYRAATPFRASAGNNFCNSGANPDYDICLLPSSSTHSQEPAIHAWKANDAAVEESEAFVPGEGLFRVSAKASDLGTGFWHYEYAVYNVNSHRSAGSFRIPLPLGAAVENIGFSAPFYHSGEPYDNAPWTAEVQEDAIVWSTQTYEENQDANALRWGTLYNFRVDVGVMPEATSATIGLFRPGSPTIITAATIGPAAGFRDCNANMVDDPCDISCEITGCAAPCGGSADCNSNGLPDECEPDCNENDIADECDIRDLTSSDCDANHVPDECDPDCDDDGTPDACEVDLDADDDGVPDCEDLCPETTPPGSCLCPELDRCCYSVGICIDNYPRNECISQGGTPACQASPCHQGCLAGDWDGDGDIDLFDMSMLLECFSGFSSPGYQRPSAECLLNFDYDDESDVDVDDFRRLRDEMTGPS